MFPRIPEAASPTELLAALSGKGFPSSEYFG